MVEECILHVRSFPVNAKFEILRPFTAISTSYLWDFCKKVCIKFVAAFIS